MVENLLPKGSEHRIDIPDEIAKAAERAVAKTEVNLAAISQAACKRWDPTVNEFSSDEDGKPVFGDREFDAFLKTAEELAECAWFMDLAGFFGLPEDVVKEALATKLINRAVDPKQRKSLGVVVKRHGVATNERQS